MGKNIKPPSPKKIKHISATPAKPAPNKRGKIQQKDSKGLTR